ncbi:MAG: HEAT repeat domain-containing protein [Burkholderiaceae bacterium]|nr:HEAT repeat domain-containing protein [Burkholderiaceae bacterium]
MGLTKQPRQVRAQGDTQDDERGVMRDCAGLALALDSEDAVARRWAARDLLHYPQQASVILLRRLVQETQVSVREVILTSLARLGDAAAVAGLVGCMRSDDAQLRNEAIVALKGLPEEIAPVMGTLLADSDPDVRILAVNILESLRHPMVEQWLLAVIEHDQEVNVCATAVDLLGELGSSAARAPLQRLKQRFADQPYIQFAADLALKRIGAD